MSPVSKKGNNKLRCEMERGQVVKKMRLAQTITSDDEIQTKIYIKKMIHRFVVIKIQCGVNKVHN